MEEEEEDAGDGAPLRETFELDPGRIVFGRTSRVLLGILTSTGSWCFVGGGIGMELEVGRYEIDDSCPPCPSKCLEAIPVSKSHSCHEG